MTGPELDLLEGGGRVVPALLCENSPRWSARLLTSAADHVSTLAIYARYPIRLETAGMGGNAVARYRRYYRLEVPR